MRPLQFRLVALIAAYAVALHTLLSAFGAVAPAGVGLHIAELCAGPPADDSGSPPGRHELPCAVACAMLGGKLAAVAGPIVTPAAPMVALVLGPALGETFPNPTIAATPRARAPPPA